MVYHIYTEKREPHNIEAKYLQDDFRKNLNIEDIKNVRIINRYLVEGINEEIFNKSVHTIFSAPMSDEIIYELPFISGGYVFAIESLPGQYDQRADTCAQCIQILSQGERPLVKSAKVYIIENENGEITSYNIEKIKKYLINEVESREADLYLEGMPETLAEKYDIPQKVAVLTGFINVEDAELLKYIDDLSLSMDIGDLLFCRDYFKNEEKRDPTITELRLIDTYWSDHCRHTTFLTQIENAVIRDNLVKNTFIEYLDLRNEVYGKNNGERPITLMDLATLAAKYLKKTGKLKNLDESDEVNACSVKIKADINGREEDWLLMFKNETHNHPTEIEPFGGAATCLGGAIRDPLSGRAYVYQAMRVTGSADPRTSLEDTIPGKLTQRQITKGAANGYSSYGNQIGVCTGGVFEIYHPGFVAKRMELGAVIAAAPQENVVRGIPEPGDVVILLGGRTGRDGCGGATGSSKGHTSDSAVKSGAEVQKGNPVEEHKIQRLFRNPNATKLIKRCNDFGAGGVSVAIGELADSLFIDLSLVPKKYEGLDGTELAISESQERMAVVVAKKDAEKFISLALSENLEATEVAKVTDDNYLRMVWNGEQIVAINREFLNSNGAKKFTDIEVDKNNTDNIFDDLYEKIKSDDVKEFTKNLLSDLNICSQKGLVEMFDASIGAANIFSPFGGKMRLTPAQSMACKLPVLRGDTNTASVLAHGYSPYMSDKSPYHSAMYAIVESVSKLIAAGVERKDIYLTLQEYFPKTAKDPKRFGLPFNALLGAFKAQTGLELAAIGGKDSMSGSFNDIDVPPTLVSFAVGTTKASRIVTNVFNKSGNNAYLLKPLYNDDMTPDFEDLKKLFNYINDLISDGVIISAYAVGYGGTLEAVAKMCFGNALGFNFAKNVNLKEISSSYYGAFVVETTTAVEGEFLGAVTNDAAININGTSLDLNDLIVKWFSPLEDTFPTDFTKIKESENIVVTKYTCDKPTSLHNNISYKGGKPNALITAYPGTNSEYDTLRRFDSAGANAETFLFRNLTPELINESITVLADMIKQSKILVFPGGFSGGDEPDGSGKFITTIFRNPLILDAVNDLLNNRDGLILGICNGFQVLIKLGLLPYGEIKPVMDKNDPTLSFNTIGRHSAGIYYTRIASVCSPWMNYCTANQIHAIPFSHGEGRFVADDEFIEKLARNGQIATQYVDLTGKPTMNPLYNPNGSAGAIEGILSPDGRILGKMGHCERTGINVFKNIPFNMDQRIIESGVKYFK